MAIDLLTNPGGLMRKLARIGKYISLHRTYLLTTNPKDTGTIDSILDEYATNRSYGNEIVNIHLAGRDGMIATLEQFRQMARKTLIQQVMDQANNPPPKPDLRLCLETLIDEMRQTPNDVNAQAIALGLQASPIGTNVGDGVNVWSIIRPDGQVAETVFDESVLLRCIRDSYSGLRGQGIGLVRPGEEEFELRGEQGALTTMHPEYGETANFGSGGYATFTTCNPRGDFSLGNLLRNSDMEDWTGATPNFWAKTDANSQIAQTTTSGEFYDGSSALKIIGHATGTPEFWQEFDSNSGTAYVAKSFTNYALSFYGKVSVVPAAGVLTVSMTDGANAALTSQYSSTGHFASPTSQTNTYALNGWTTSFVNKQATFRLKRNLSTVRLHFKVTTSLSAGSNAFIDRIALTPMTPVVPGVGPWCATFGGLTSFSYGDNYSQPISNDRGGSTLLNTFQALFIRLFPEMADWDLLLPSDTGGTETIADSLITA